MTWELWGHGNCGDTILNSVPGAKGGNIPTTCEGSAFGKVHSGVTRTTTADGWCRMGPTSTGSTPRVQGGEEGGHRKVVSR